MEGEVASEGSAESIEAPVESGEVVEADGAPEDGASNGVAEAEADYAEYKVNGEVKKVPRALLKQVEEHLGIPEDEMLGDTSLRQASHQRFREVAEMKKQIESEKEKYASLRQMDPGQLVDALRDEGFDVDALSQEAVIRQIQLEQMSPEERRIMEYEQRMAQLEEQNQSLLTAQQEKEKSARMQVYAEEFSNDFETAFETMGLEPTGSRMARGAHYMLSALEQGVELTPTEAAKMAHDEWRGDIQEFAKAMTPEQAMEFVGEDFLKLLRRADLDRVNASAAPRNTMPENAPRPKREPGKKKMTLDDFQDALERKRDGW